ncbi:MAG: hypothetical protein ACYC0Z_07495 [Acidobacteriaceae bacterium]
MIRGILLQSLGTRSPQQIGVAVLAAATVTLAVWFIVRKRRTPPEEIERRRRMYLVEKGRIIDGTVTDISDMNGEISGLPNGMQLLLYRYEIAGVVYECAQDVTHLQDHVDLQNCRIDLPVSIRYDARNPANSIVVSETWTGLRIGRIGHG